MPVVCQKGNIFCKVDWYIDDIKIHINQRVHECTIINYQDDLVFHIATEEVVFVVGISLLIPNSIFNIINASSSTS